MSLILHLSDLHLRRPGFDEDIGDYKARFVPKAERQTRVSLLRNTLRGLNQRLSSTGEVLSAVVVSGDVTVYGQRAGLEMLPELLSELGGHLPASENIMVVPGNHDIGFGTASSSDERYADFIACVRDAGYRTPWLEGPDGVATQETRRATTLVCDEFVVVGLNSCNYSGSVEPVSDEAARQLLALDSDDGEWRELVREIAHLREYDAARVSPEQLASVAEALREADLDRDRVRIVTFHHQLLPVTLAEELKPFETFTNLAELRTMLADARVDVVLHGHKHSPAAFEDSFTRLRQADANVHRCVVVSAGTIGGQVGHGQEVAKLIEIKANLPRIRRVAVESLPALSAGSELPVPTTAGAPLEFVLHDPVARSTDGSLLDGNTVADVHEKLEDLFQTEHVVGPLICKVQDPGAGAFPELTYPFVEGVADLRGWFEGQVAWWQSSTPADGKPFTHGDYIRHWGGFRDQVQDAITTLTVSPQTSRAVIALYDPSRAADSRLGFPSFTAVHLKVHDSRLDAVALFRKQEMRYWWSINVAEISGIQHEVAAAISKTGRIVGQGAITTVTSEPVFSDTVPKVAVPQIDQLTWMNSQKLVQVAAAICDTRMATRELEVDYARRLFNELRAPSNRPADGPYVSVAGPQRFVELLSALATGHDAGALPGVGSLVEYIESLVNCNRAQVSHPRGDQIGVYEKWALECNRLLQKIDASLKLA